MSKFQSFSAPMLLGQSERATDVVSFNGSMAVCCSEGPVIITRAQVMEFFDLHDVADEHLWDAYAEGRKDEAECRAH